MEELRKLKENMKEEMNSGIDEMFEPAEEAMRNLPKPQQDDVLYFMKQSVSCIDAILSGISQLFKKLISLLVEGWRWVVSTTQKFVGWVKSGWNYLFG